MKIIFGIIVFFCFFTYVNAETFYGEYRLVDDFGEYKDDLLKIETFKLFNTYKNTYVDMGYMLENNEYIKDENDFIEEYVTINENDMGDEYIKLKSPDKETYILQFKEFKSNMKIYEVEIFHKNNKLSYGFMYNLNNEIFNISDNDYSTYIDCSAFKNLYLNLYSRYNSSDLTLNIYTDDIVDYKFSLSFDNYSTNITLHNKNKNKHIISFNNETEIKYEYKGLKKLYKYYKEDKEALNYYVENGNNILIDDYIEFDNYYIRDKLILNDIMIITNGNDKVEDFIEYSSGDVNVNCNIDYSVNGLYSCEFVLNDIIVKKDIVVNVPQVEEISVVNNINYDEKNNNKIINNLNRENNDDIVYMKKNNKESKKEIKNSNVSIHKNNLIKYIKYIIIFNLIIIEITLFFKKKKK